MEAQRNEQRYNQYYKWGKELYVPYDYEREGLINHLVTKNIVETKNTTTRIILSFYESSLVFLMKCVDRLKHFKDAAWKNR